MKRRRYSNEFKYQIVQEVLSVSSTTIVGRKHSISPNLISRWVREYKTNGSFGNSKDKSHYPSHIRNPEDYNKALKENNHLKKLLDKKELEITILRDMLKKKNSQ